MESPEDKNYAAIQRLEGLLRELRVNPSRAGQAEAIREVGAMLINVGWEQTFAADRRPVSGSPEAER
jgi:hypothetical protein